MIVLVSGGCKNGKSSLAQKMACELAQSSGKKLIYFATMIPCDDEDEERIKKHREDRRNLGFETVECGKNIAEDVLNSVKGGIVLFDSLTALVANEMFDSFPVKKNVSEIIRSELNRLIEAADSVVFVSDAIYSDGRIYEETTELYRRILAETERFIAKNADKVVEMASGREIENGNRERRPDGKNCEKVFERLSGQLCCEGKTEELKTPENDKNFQLIIGGAYQGKTEWAKKRFSLSDEEIFSCGTESKPDFSKRCITHYENYVAYCLKNNIQSKTDFSDCQGAAQKIIICDDIFCGVVPVDSFQRKLREQTGLALQKIAEKAHVTRIFCGKAQEIN